MLKLFDIKKDYHVSKVPLPVLKGINIEFSDKEFVAILGPSGCGKTTLLNIIGGLDTYTSGDLVIDGKSTKKFNDSNWDSFRNHRIGFVFQNYNLIMHLNVLENVELALTLSGVGVSERRMAAKTALQKVGLDEELYKKPNQLSGGQMQRVAIARALVNNPDILLADEPTGALDSTTSAQIMDILAKISKDKLVIMVTHNQEIAKTYATRVVTLKDGEVVSDSKNLLKQNAPQHEQFENEFNKKTSMSFITALKISFKNLLTKKGRTITTAIAGSFGIIGVALVLAISSGYNNYIIRLERDTLSGFPLAISQVTYDMESSGNTWDEDKTLIAFPEGDELIVREQKQSKLHFNAFNMEYKKIMDGIAANKGLCNDIRYVYNYANNLIKKTPNGNYKIIDTRPSTAQLLSVGFASTRWQEMLNNKDFVLSQYDVIGTSSHYPENPNEIALVVDRYNRVDKRVLTALGLMDEGDAEKKLNFDDILTSNSSYKIIADDAFYEETNLGEKVFDLNQNKERTLPLFYTPNSQTKLKNVYEQTDATKTIDLKITAILRIKEEVPISILSTGLAYLPSLTPLLKSINKNSHFADEFASAYATVSVEDKGITKDVIKYYDIIDQNKEILDQSAEIDRSIIFFQKLINHSYDLLKSPLFKDIPISLSELEFFDITQIQIYPTGFSAKTKIIKILDDFNVGKQDESQIFYNDGAAAISDSMGTMVSLISTVLIAFASISLLVSSVMIGVITYISVIERTKEIGVLRALGARKKDVRRLFQAETVIIGFASGTLGVIITYLASIPINIIINNLYPGEGLQSVADLPILLGLVLIAASIALTSISGIFPSRMAAKKNPVEALRSE